MTATAYSSPGRTRHRRLEAWGPAAALGAGAAFTALAYGNFAVAAAAWLAPTFLLLGLRRDPRLIGLAAALLCLAHMVAWRSALPFHGASYVAVTTAIGLVFWLPFCVDRALHPRLGRGLRTLVFPVSLVCTELAVSRLGFGTWGLLPYSQAGELPLLQMLSLTGLSGVTFLIAWAASVAADTVLFGLAGAGRRVVVLCLSLLTFAIVAGALRLAFAPLGTPTVAIAGIAVDNLAVFKNTWGPLTYGKPLTPGQAQEARGQTRKLQLDLLARTAVEAERGARIVVWTEGNALVFKADEPSFIEEGRQLAARKGIYLFMSMATMTPGERLVENKVVVVDPAGRVRDSYLKSHPTPGEMSVSGDRRVRWMDTPYGRLAWAICYDFDFPELIRQAGRARADILIDPSWENRGMTPLHSNMAAFRAIENGASLFRPVNGGLGIAIDPYGRVVSSLDHFAQDPERRVLRADLPMRGAPANYASLAPWIEASAAVGLAILCVGAFRPRSRSKAPARGGAPGRDVTLRRPDFVPDPWNAS